MKMLGCLIGIFGLLLCGSPLSAQRYSSMVDDQEVYRFLDWLTSRLSEQNEGRKIIVSRDIKRWKETNFVEKEMSLASILRKRAKGVMVTNADLIFQNDADSLFREKDREYLFRQFLAQNEGEGTWRKRFRESWFSLRAQPNEFQYQYAVPLFSEDRQYVVCLYKIAPNKERCDVYRRNPAGQWEFVKTLLDLLIIRI